MVTAVDMVFPKAPVVGDFTVPQAIENLIAEMFKETRWERNRLTNIYTYVKNKAHDIYVPRQATREFRMLVDQSRFNVLPLVVKVISQNLFVDGYRTGDERENLPVWDEIWQPNRMDARQAGLYKMAVQYGYSYASVMPGNPVPVITPYTPRKVIARYQNLQDEWPQYVITLDDKLNQDEWGGLTDLSLDPLWPENCRISLYDDTTKWQLQRVGGAWKILEISEHGLEVCPFVKFWDSYDDLDEDSVGVVEPLLPVQRQLNQTTFSLLMAQQYAAFRQRWVTGMTIEEDVHGRPREPFNSAVDKLFHAESPDTKFGEFEQTDLGGYLNSRDKLLMFISSVTQIPPNNLMVGSGISNLSAEALASLEAGLRRNVGEHQTSFGESVEQMIRLSGKAAGQMDVWENTSAQVVWRDTTPRSLAQVADALGKLATMLAIPPRVLWEKIPGTTQQDLEMWETEADRYEAKEAARQQQLLRAAQQGMKTATPNDASVGRAKNTAAPGPVKE